VQLSGTLRAHDPLIRNGLEARVRRIVEHAAAAYGATAEVRIVHGYPPVVNNIELSERFVRYLRANTALPIERFEPTMGAEDFAYFAQRVPGVQVRLGIHSEAAGAVHPAHGAEFRLDEAALAVGVQTLVAFAVGAGSGDI